MSFKKGIAVLTRQSRFIDAGDLAQVRSLGYKPVQIPTIQVNSISECAESKKSINFLENYTDIAFVSRNAVKYGMSLLQQAPERIRVLSVGEQTGKELIDLGVSPLFPTEEYKTTGAKALMALPELDDMTDRKVLIVRGKQGLDWLRDEMIARGAQVDYAICYQTQIPEKSAAILKQTLKGADSGVILIHSVQSVTNLLVLSAEQSVEIKRFTAVAGSQRIADHLNNNGWLGEISVAKSPSNEHMLECLSLHS